ncbi:MAG: hypothetical protein KC619_14340 [Myxococcales bacterium]|nr:hypothetical protein [Myxococcales bacterium]
MKRFPLLFPLVALVAGCLPARGDAMHLNYYNRRYCLYSNGSQTGLSYNNSVSPGMEPAVAFQRLMCHADARGEYHEWAYAQLDPAAPDPLVTALMLVDCVATGACGPVEVERNHGPSAARTSDSFRFARDIDPGAVQAALVGVEAPEEVKEAFLRRLDACRAHIVSSVAHMHPRLRAVYVDTIERTREDRRALLADLAPVAQSYEAVRPQMDDALLNGSFNVDVHERVRAIRDAAILTCTAQHHRSVAICANGPITHVLGEYLVRSAAGLERPDEAAAEQRLLNDVPNTTDERYALHLAVGEAMARETSMAREYAAASERLSSSAPAERERLLSELKAQQDDIRERTREAMEQYREQMRQNNDEMRLQFEEGGFRFAPEGNVLFFSTEDAGVGGKTQSALEKQLLADGLIETAANYRFELSGKGWVKVEGKKQPRAAYEKYKKLWQETTGEEVGEDTHIRINKKSQAR